MAPQREWFEKDYYKVLGISETATEKEITRAYRQLAKQFHPDANPGSEERFKEVSAAYDVLGDPAKRKEYDEVRRLGPMAAGGFGGAAPGGFGGGFRVDDITDLLGGLFNRGRATRRPTGPQRGADLETELNLSFADALAGATTAVNVVSDKACGACSGSGAAPGTSPVICPGCGGRGVTDENQGLFSFSQPCRLCGGTGMRIETPCPTCSGTGVVHGSRSVKVRIPAGVTSGSRIRVKGRGAAGLNGGPSGDLYVVVHVSPHQLFGRKGKHLTLTVPITFAEATLGAEVKVPTMGAPVTVKIPPGTASGTTLRVKGRGAPSSGGPGDLLVRVEVQVPKISDEHQRQAVEDLAKALPDSPRDHLGV